MAQFNADIEVGDPFAQWSTDQHARHEKGVEATARVEDALRAVRELVESIAQSLTVVEDSPDGEGSLLRARVQDFLLDRAHELGEG